MNHSEKQHKEAEQLLQKNYPLFEAPLLSEIESKAEFRMFEPNEVLMRKGQYIRSTMLILTGLVKVYREDDEGNEFLMYYLKPGEACALSLVCAARHEASPIMAKTVTTTEVLMVPVEVMSEWMGKYKSWYQFVIETYRNRFDELLATIDSIAFRSLDERLEFYLHRAKQVEGVNTIEVSHQEIAQELNTSREVISRLLKKMEQRGKVKLSRNAIEIF
ncbi:MAG: Crp/Fnr family transcriptional regulator [Chitinophagaceae bacterium]